MSRWPLRRLDELLLRLESGSRPTGGVSGISNGVPSIGGEHLNKEGGFEFQGLKLVPEKFFSHMGRGIIQRDDILVVKDGATTGKTSFIGEDFPYQRAAINEHVFLLRVNRKLVLPRFAFYFLFGPWGRAQVLSCFRGAAIGGIGQDFVRSVELPLPPLSEQERIVRILDEAEALRRLRGDADERTNQIRAGLFDKMFGNPSSNSKGWETATLGGLGTVITGNTPPRSDSSFYGDFIEWVKTDNIDPTRGVVTRATEGLSEGGALRGRLVPAGAVLVTCIAGSIERIGDAAVVDREVAINQQINALIPSGNVASAFLAELVFALRQAIQNRAAGVMTRIINKSTLEAVPAICPPRPLQGEFESHVVTIRELQASQAASRQRLADLFESLLHRTFEGEL